MFPSHALERDRRSGGQAGWTIWESLVALNIVGLAVIAFVGVFASMEDARHDAYAYQAAREDLRRNLESLAGTLREVDVASLDGFDAAGRSSRFSFRTLDAAGYPGAREELRWAAGEPDASGIARPGRVVHVRDGQEREVAVRVPEGGFAVRVDAGMLVLELTTYHAFADRIQVVRGSTSLLLHP